MCECTSLHYFALSRVYVCVLVWENKKLPTQNHNNQIKSVLDSKREVYNKKLRLFQGLPLWYKGFLFLTLINWNALVQDYSKINSFMFLKNLRLRQCISD